MMNRLNTVSREYKVKEDTKDSKVLKRSKGKKCSQNTHTRNSETEQVNQSINFHLFMNRNDIHVAALLLTNLSMIKKYYTIKLKVS